jgi:DUF1365 family protein
VTSALYHGELVHVRRDGWAARRFRHGLTVACLDLDELPALSRRLRLFSYNRRNLFGLRDRDYRVAGGDGLAAGARALLAARGLPVPHRIELVTQLRTAGYVFNPVSFFLGYDAGGALETVIAEVNNTYGGNRCYVLGPPHRLRGATADRAGFVHERDFFVSPFLHGEARYDFWFTGAAPGAPRLDVRMDTLRPDGERIFLARLTGTRAPLDDAALLREVIRGRALPVRVIGLIYWQAMKLHWARVPYRRPGPEHRVARH